jgi:hypothetical protein
MACAVGGLLIVRQRFSHEMLSVHHDVAACFMTVIGTLYAVVLGFIVVESLNTFQDARQNVGNEANALHDLFHIADGLEQPVKGRIRQLCLNYAQTMVDKEWPAMQDGHGAPESHVVTMHLWHDIVYYDPKGSDNKEDLHGAMLQQVQRLSDSRHTRLIAANPNYNPVVWSALIVGGIITVVFTYFFGVKNIWVQALMTALVTLVLGLNLVLVELFDTPFSGDVNVSPQPFEADIKYFQTEDAELFAKPQ